MVGPDQFLGDAVHFIQGYGLDAGPDRLEIVVGQSELDHLKDLAHDSARALEVGRETAQDTLLGVVQFFLADGPGPADVIEFFQSLEHRFLGDLGLHRASGQHQGRAAEPLYVGLITVAIALVLPQVLVQPGGELAAKGVVHQR